MLRENSVVPIAQSSRPRSKAVRLVVAMPAVKRRHLRVATSHWRVIRTLCTQCPGITGMPGATSETCLANATTMQTFGSIVEGFEDATLDRFNGCLSRVSGNMMACVTGFQACLNEVAPAIVYLEICC
jgi:hypothetical protein